MFSKKIKFKVFLIFYSLKFNIEASNICFSGSARITFNMPASKILIAFPVFAFNKSPIHRDLSI